MKSVALICSAIVVVLVLLLVLSDLRILFSLSPWKTQEIVYRHRMDRSCRIEYQMQDVGAFGYNRRVVKVESFLFIDFAEEVDTTQLSKSDWQRVDEYVNELGLKGNKDILHPY